MWNIKNKILSIKPTDIPDDLFLKCPYCGHLTSKDALVANLYTCSECHKFLKVPAQERINYLVDAGTFEPITVDNSIRNPLDFPKYDKKIKHLRKETKLDEAIMIGKAKMHGNDLIIGVMDSRFLMGSMGSHVGELITKAFELATEQSLPVILYTASGGARMQEGIISLMQMAKISAAIKRHSDAGNFYMPVLTDPTTGGVTASFAMLGDIIVAEKGTLICFAGPRVIKETIKAELPKGFQRAEFLLDHGFLDCIIDRPNQKEFLTQMLIIHKKEQNDSL